MNFRRATMPGLCLALAVLLPAFPARAAAPDVPHAQTYRVLGALLQSLRAGEPLEPIRAHARSIAPRLAQLGSKYRVDLPSRLESAFTSGSRSEVMRAALLAGLLETRFSVESVARDELTGWQAAKANAARAFQAYDAISPSARAFDAPCHAGVMDSFMELIGSLSEADLTTAPGRIEIPKRKLLRGLNFLSEKAVPANVPDARGGGVAAP
ncbi:MAG: hypothetical protein HZB25_04120 [Candidatus Eisenbacteria bacterium]|nr:hypothetical protein [Candidatus Eisenbacteria bacterium]